MFEGRSKGLILNLHLMRRCQDGQSPPGNEHYPLVQTTLHLPASDGKWQQVASEDYAKIKPASETITSVLGLDEIVDAKTRLVHPAFLADHVVTESLVCSRITTLRGTHPHHHRSPKNRPNGQHFLKVPHLVVKWFFSLESGWKCVRSVFQQIFGSQTEVLHTVLHTLLALMCKAQKCEKRQQKQRTGLFCKVLRSISILWCLCMSQWVIQKRMRVATAHCMTSPIWNSFTCTNNTFSFFLLFSKWKFTEQKFKTVKQKWKCKLFARQTSFESWCSRTLCVRICKAFRCRFGPVCSRLCQSWSLKNCQNVHFSGFPLCNSNKMSFAMTFWKLAWQWSTPMDLQNN